MGEAKRRKLAGTYPNGLRVEEFRCEEGHIAITVDIEGCDPGTAIIDADKIADLMAAVRKQAGADDYYTLARGFGGEWKALKAAGDDAAMQSMGVLAFYLAFYHPKGGKQMRDRVSQELRHKSKAHITMSLSPRGLAFALAERFVELENAVALVPHDTAVVIGPEPGIKDVIN